MTRHSVKSRPSLTPMIHHYCLTSITAILSIGGFVGALLAGLSCEFLQVHLNDDALSLASMSLVERNSTDDWYVEEISERRADHTLSTGVFCPNSFITDEDNDRVKLSQGFLMTCLVLGGLLICLTLAISTVLSNTDRIWSIISFTSGISFLSQFPVFLLLDSPPCTNVDYTCSLSRGSYGLFYSMTSYLVLFFITQWREAPDWKEEYELWQLKKRNFEDRETTQRDIEMARSFENDKPVGANFKLRDVEAQSNHNNTASPIPPPPPLPPTHNDMNPPAITAEKERRLARQNRISETANFVGTYINFAQGITTPERSHAENQNISPITLVNMSKDGSSTFEMEVHKKTEVPHTTHYESMESITRQLEKNLEVKRNSGEQQKQHEKEQQQMEDDSFLDHSDIDINIIAYQQAYFGKDSFDRTVYADMPDLSSIIVSDDEDDSSRVHAPTLPVHENTRAVKNVPSVAAVPQQPTKVVDDGSVAKSVRSVSTRSSLGISAKQVNESMKSIFRKKSDMENRSKNKIRNETREMIMEPWMLEETSMGRSNSDDLLFLVERNRQKMTSTTPRRPEVNVLHWPNRCHSLDKGTNKPLAIVSPTLPQTNHGLRPYNYQMSSETTSVKSTEPVEEIAVVSPEKDDPGLEMYPSDGSMSTLSLPTASGYYTSEEDHGSISSKKDGNAHNRGAYNGTDSDADEMSIIIAGVQRMNRKTCGKPSHLSKRRRRRKKSSSRSRCSISEYSSQSGSLLHKVIDEEGPLNDSGEPIPAVIDASLVKSTKKSKRNQVVQISDDEHSGYESGYAYRSDVSDNEPEKAGRHLLSESEESTSSRAARARRNRLLTKRQVSIDPDSMPNHSEVMQASIDASSDDSSWDGSKSQQSQQQKLEYGGSIPLIGDDANIEGCLGSNTQRGNLSWQARNIRMSRLRMQRQVSDPIVRESSVVIACASGEGSI